jgi:protoporphyrinogen oxidase
MSIRVVILGAGPAGLGAACKLAQRGFNVTVVERNAALGGNAGSFSFAGMAVDFGSHRLHPSCAPEILADIREMLGDDLLDRPRHGRIRLRGRWVGFPLKFLNLLSNLPLSFTAGAALDSLKKLGSKPGGETFADVLEQGLGKTICRDFYFPYARKIWGVDPRELDREQARRRVAAGSVLKLIRKILGGVPGAKSNAGQRFYYPRNGFGAISEAYAAAATRAGAKILRETTVSGIDTTGGRVRAVHCRNKDGEHALPADLVLSTIPVSHLVRMTIPEPPLEVHRSACTLKFRSMILIYMALEAEQFTEFDAHYFPGADVMITRLSEPKHYGLSAPPGVTVLCAELPCSQDDGVWRASDKELAEIVRRSLRASGLPTDFKIRDIASRRLPQAYPIYTRDYGQHFDRVDQWVNSTEGLVTFGRQGLFAHDNTHHTLAMAYALNKCIDDSGKFDRPRWAEHRKAFEHHVVED